jgi:hypothetical protein
LTIDLQNSKINFENDINMSNNNKKFIIEERRRLVAKLWAQSKTETEIARELHCNVSTICRDIKFLKKLSQQFVFDLAKDLDFIIRGVLTQWIKYNKKAGTFLIMIMFLKRINY